MIIRSLAIAAVASAMAGQAHAQTPPPEVDKAFVTAVMACTANAQGNLAFNPPSDALAAAGVFQADSGSAADLMAFKDMSASNRIFVSTFSSSGQILAASDTSQGLCRVAADDVTPAQIAAIQAAVRDLAGNWVPQSNTGGATTYSGTIDNSSQLMFEVRVPAKGAGYGSAGIVLTVMNPAGPG
jgi:hypothetical protein